MNKKILVALSLILCVTFTFGGCAKNQIQTTDKTVDTVKKITTAIQPGTYPIVKDKVTLKIFTQLDPVIENMDTNILTKEYEEKTNVHIDWQLVAAKDLEQKRNLLIAANADMPDVFLSKDSTISNTQQIQFGSQGILLELNDLIDKYGYYIQKMFEYKPEIKKIITAPNGKIYALPEVSETYHTTFGQKMWINQDWLTKLSLKMPTTTDELYTVLKAFKEKDPNGNGKADEIPLTGAIKGYNMNVYNFIMCAFIYDRGLDEKERPFILENGKVSVPFDKPEWQEGLKYLNKLYKDGLLDAGAVTQDNIQLKQLAEKKDTVLLGCVTAGAPTGFMGGTNERIKLYTAVPPLKGPKGVQTAANYPYQINLGKFAITKSCKTPDVALRWVDWFYSIEGTLRSNVGRQDTEWRYGKAGEIGLNGQPASLVRLLSFGTTQNINWNKTVPNFYPEAFKSAQIEQSDLQSKPLYETTKVYEQFKPKEVLPPLFMTADESEEYNGLDYTISEYLKETMARFTVGDMSLDKDWATYLKEFDKMGLKKYIDMTQKAYDRQYKK